MNHSVKKRRQALHQTHHHHYLNISVEAANLSDWRIESNRNFFLPELECSTTDSVIPTEDVGCPSVGVGGQSDLDLVW